MIQVVDTIFPHTKMVRCSEEEAEIIRKIAGVRWLKQIGRGGEYTIEVYKRFDVNGVVEEVKRQLEEGKAVDEIYSPD